MLWHLRSELYRMCHKLPCERRDGSINKYAMHVTTHPDIYCLPVPGGRRRRCCRSGRRPHVALLPHPVQALEAAELDPVADILRGRSVPLALRQFSWVIVVQGLARVPCLRLSQSTPMLRAQALQELNTISMHAAAYSGWSVTYSGL